MIKSFLNYPGGKYKLLPQLLPLFPKEYNKFIDLFAGSAVVSVNSKLNVPMYAYDNNEHLIELLIFIQETPLEKVENMVDKIISKYGLSNTFEYGYDYYDSSSTRGLKDVNKDSFNKLRDDYNMSYNLSKNERICMLYVLIIFGFNNQIRFNKSGEFNNPTGKRDFNIRMRKKLTEFSNRLKEIDIHFKCSDFNDVSIGKKGNFYYVDPPYLITNAVYNENDGWNENDEINLLNKLDNIDKNGGLFALSNVFESKGMKNDILINWSKRYNVYHLNMSYSNSNYQVKSKGFSDEVLVTNYKNKG